MLCKDCLKERDDSDTMRIDEARFGSAPHECRECGKIVDDNGDRWIPMSERVVRHARQMF